MMTALPPITSQALASAVAFILRRLRGLLESKDVKVTVEGIEVRLTMDQELVAALDPLLREYLRIEGTRATAQLITAFALLQDSNTRAQRERDDARVAEEELAQRWALVEILSEDTRLPERLRAALADGDPMRERLTALLDEEIEENAARRRRIWALLEQPVGLRRQDGWEDADGREGQDHQRKRADRSGPLGLGPGRAG